LQSGTILLVICFFLLPLMRFLTRAAGADKIMSFGKKKSASAVKFDLQSFPIAMGLIILVILAFLLAPITAFVIVMFAARRGIQMLIWAGKKIKLKEKSPENLQSAVPAKLIFAGVILICSCGLALYSCYLLEMRRFNSNPGNKKDFLDLHRLKA
jgi:ABC-type Fe3+ transport system permease subunit